MTKKLLLITIFSVVLTLGLSINCFAKSENVTTTLGNEVTTSMNRTEKNMGDLADKTNLDNVGQSIENGVGVVGNVVRDGINNVGNTITNGMNDMSNEENDMLGNNRNNAVAGTTGNYTAAQVQTDVNANQGGISLNAWIWIIMAIAALMIIAFVWFYAAQ